MYDSVSRVCVDSGGVASGQGSHRKSALLSALDARKREVITDVPTG